jgi:membrane protein DedA with SNARE-associated domain
MANTIQWFQSYTSAKVFAGVFLETVGLPIPAEIVLLIAGAIVTPHSASLLEVVLAGILAAVSGDLFLFFFGRRITEDRERRIIMAYCRWSYCTLGSAHCQGQARRFLKCFNIHALLFGKFVVGARQFMAPVAGMLRIDSVRFITLDFFGASLWVITMTLLGYFARRYVATTIHVFAEFKTLAALTLILLSVGFIAWRAWNFHRSGAARL